MIPRSNLSSTLAGKFWYLKIRASIVSWKTRKYQLIAPLKIQFSKSKFFELALNHFAIDSLLFGPHKAPILNVKQVENEISLLLTPFEIWHIMPKILSNSLCHDLFGFFLSILCSIYNSIRSNLPEFTVSDLPKKKIRDAETHSQAGSERSKEY